MKTFCRVLSRYSVISMIDILSFLIHLTFPYHLKYVQLQHDQARYPPRLKNESVKSSRPRSEIHVCCFRICSFFYLQTNTSRYHWTERLKSHQIFSIDEDTEFRRYDTTRPSNTELVINLNSVVSQFVFLWERFFSSKFSYLQNPGPFVPIEYDYRKLFVTRPVSFVKSNVIFSSYLFHLDFLSSVRQRHVNVITSRGRNRCT